MRLRTPSRCVSLTRPPGPRAPPAGSRRNTRGPRQPPLVSWPGGVPGAPGSGRSDGCEQGSAGGPADCRRCGRRMDTGNPGPTSSARGGRSQAQALALGIALLGPKEPRARGRGRGCSSGALRGRGSHAGAGTHRSVPPWLGNGHGDARAPTLPGSYSHLPGQRRGPGPGVLPGGRPWQPSASSVAVTGHGAAASRPQHHVCSQSSVICARLSPSVLALG